MIGQGIVGGLLGRALDVRATTRHPELVSAQADAAFEVFEAEGGDLAGLVAGYGAGDTVVNSLGLIKQYIREDDLADRRSAIAINADFPHALAALAAERGFRVIHVTTDCVYSGRRGNYVETDAHDATDAYGKSKSLGEVPAPGVLNLRTSVIGPELRGFRSLLHWVLDHKPESSFDGYTDHRWNGLTSQAFGRIVAGIVVSDHPLEGTVHLMPTDSVTKFELSSMILDAFGRTDVTVRPKATGHPVDRVLSTADPDTNARLWRDAGYDAVPSVHRMVLDLPTTSRPYGVK